MRSTTSFLLLFLLAACQQSPPERATQQPIAEPTGAPAAKEPTLAQRLSPLLSGYWVSADYLREVARTRSPAAAFDHTPPAPSSLKIGNFATQQDSVEIGASYGLHEGGNLTLLLQADTQPNSLKVREPYGGEAGTSTEVAYQVTSADTTLLYLTRNSKTNRLVSKIAYRRTGMPGKHADLEAGVALGINKLLLAGRYAGTDSIGQPINVQFFTDGRVAGLPFKKYTIQTDFAGPNPGDELIFDVYTKQQHKFAATYGRDTVRLYTIRSTVGVPAGEADTTLNFSRGRLRYQLIRSKRP